MYLSLKKALFSWLFLGSLALTSIALPQAQATVPVRGEDEISAVFFNYGYPRHRHYYRDRYYYGNYGYGNYGNYWYGRNYYPRYYRNYYYDPYYYNYYDYPYRDRGGVYFYWGR